MILLFELNRIKIASKYDLFVLLKLISCFFLSFIHSFREFLEIKSLRLRTFKPYFTNFYYKK